MIGGISFSATSVTSGLDADKPASPKPGNQYLATDTEIVYICFTAGTWVNLDDLEIVGVANTTKLAASNDTNQAVNFEWAEIKVIYVPMAVKKAKIRISWEAGYDGGQGRVIRSAVKINDVTVTPEIETNNNWTTYYEDFTVYGGDKISLWGRYTNTLNRGGNVRNLRIYTELKYRHTLKSVGSETGWIFDVDNV